MNLPILPIGQRLRPRINPIQNFRNSLMSSSSFTSPSFEPTSGSSEITKNIITEIEDRHKFMDLLRVNPGLLIIKLGAVWCKPCHRIKDAVHGYFAQTDDDVICCDLDVDDNFDVYAYLKSKRMFEGIPTLLAYKAGNQTFLPDQQVTGANPQALQEFFQMCDAHIHDVRTNRISRTLPKR
jgi:hypothetical protein